MPAREAAKCLSMEQVIEHSSVRASRVRHLTALVHSLSAEDSALLELRIVDGWDYDHIAAVLGVDHGELVRRVRRVRTRLRREANQWQGTPIPSSIRLGGPENPRFE